MFLNKKDKGDAHSNKVATFTLEMTQQLAWTSTGYWWTKWRRQRKVWVQRQEKLPILFYGHLQDTLSLNFNITFFLTWKPIYKMET